MDNDAFVAKHKANLEYLSEQGVNLDRPNFKQEDFVAFALSLPVDSKYCKVNDDSFKLYFKLYKTGEVTAKAEIGNEDSYSGVPIPIPEEIVESMQTIQNNIDTLNEKMANLFCGGLEGFYFNSDKPAFLELKPSDEELVCKAGTVEEAYTKMLTKLDELVSK